MPPRTYLQSESLINGAIMLGLLNYTAFLLKPTVIDYSPQLIYTIDYLTIKIEHPRTLKKKLLAGECTSISLY